MSEVYKLLVVQRQFAKKRIASEQNDPKHKDSADEGADGIEGEDLLHDEEKIMTSDEETLQPDEHGSGSEGEIGEREPKRRELAWKLEEVGSEEPVHLPVPCNMLTGIRFP